MKIKMNSHILWDVWKSRDSGRWYVQGYRGRVSFRTKREAITVARASKYQPSVIESKNYEGKMCVLIYAQTQTPVYRDSFAESFRGDKWKVVGGAAPHKPKSQGRIYTQSRSPLTSYHAREFFPEAFDMRWELVENMPEKV